jgi:hypothetical protein
VLRRKTSSSSTIKTLITDSMGSPFDDNYEPLAALPEAAARFVRRHIPVILPLSIDLVN